MNDDSRPPVDSTLFAFAVAIAKEAGTYTLGYFQDSTLDVEGKDDGTPVTVADLALCHLETPLTTDLSGYPHFNGPASWADDMMDVGFDGCSTASNHVVDQGLQGALDTVAAFEAAGLGQAGIAVTEADATTPVLYDAAGITIGHVSATFSTNGIPIPRSAPWLVSGIDAEGLLSAPNEPRKPVPSSWLSACTGGSSTGRPPPTRSGPWQRPCCRRPRWTSLSVTTPTSSSRSAWSATSTSYTA